MAKEDDDDRRIRKIFKRVRKADSVVRVGDLYVDVPGTVERQVACTEGLCMTSRKLGKLKGKTCCTTFRVPVEEQDVERVARIVDQVRTIRDVGRAIDRADGWWEIQTDGAYLRTRPSGACVFLSAPRGEVPLCTIHEWAVNQGCEFRDHKPETCCLFPLYTLESDDETLITSYGTEWMKQAEPDEADEIYEFRCLHPPKGVGRSVLEEQQDELEYRFGRKRWRRVLEKLRDLGHAV